MLLLQFLVKIKCLRRTSALHIGTLTFAWIIFQEKLLQIMKFSVNDFPQYESILFHLPLEVCRITVCRCPDLERMTQITEPVSTKNSYPCHCHISVFVFNEYCLFFVGSPVSFEQRDPIVTSNT